MHPIARALEALFEKHSWRYEKRDENYYDFTFNCDVNRFNLYALIGTYVNTLSIYVHMPFQVPATRMTEIAELISRINYNMTLGNYELDFHDGEILFKVSQSFSLHEPHPDEIMILLDCALTMAQTYFPTFGAVLYGGRSVTEAVQHG